MESEPDTIQERRREDKRRETGQWAEELCARKIVAEGWRLIARNWRVRSGEIDLIAMDGDDLVFIEVKGLHTNQGQGPVMPVLAVGEKKQRRLNRLGETWIAWRGSGLNFRNARFDVVGVLFSHEGEVLDYEHIKNAF